MDQNSTEYAKAFKTEIRRAMAIDWDVPIEMDDGIGLMCDVYRPMEPGRYPVILSYGPYGKFLLFDTRPRGTG